MLQQASYSKKKTGKLKIEMIKFLALALSLLARTTMTLISPSVIINCLKEKSNFQGFNLVI